jgi:hypothetical protein
MGGIERAPVAAKHEPCPRQMLQAPPSLPAVALGLATEAEFIFFSPIGRAFGASVSPSVFGLPTGCRLARIADIRHHPVARRRAVPFLSGYRAARLCNV